MTCEVEHKIVSKRYPPGTIGFFDDESKKLVKFVKCPECHSDIAVEEKV
jgi:hypothetical protein